MSVTIYHNPRCNTSRKTLALLRDRGVEPEVVEYLKTPYTAAQLKGLLAQLKLPAKAILRHAGSVDMVALATHGYRGLSRLFLGSVADKVIRSAQVPVLVVKPKKV